MCHQCPPMAMPWKIKNQHQQTQVYTVRQIKQQPTKKMNILPKIQRTYGYAMFQNFQTDKI